MKQTRKVDWQNQKQQCARVYRRSRLPKTQRWDFLLLFSLKYSYLNIFFCEMQMFPTLFSEIFPNFSEILILMVDFLQINGF